MNPNDFMDLWVPYTSAPSAHSTYHITVSKNLSTEPPRHLCVDTFTPISRMRKAAGEMLADHGGQVCWMSSTGPAKDPRVEIVWIDIFGERKITRFQIVDDHPLETTFDFHKVVLPRTLKELTDRPDWPAWLQKKLGRTSLPHGWRYHLVDSTCGFVSRQVTILEEFGEHVLLLAYQSGWCEREEDEAEWKSAVASLAEELAQIKR